MTKKIVVPLLCFAVVVGLLSGCVQETTPNEIPVASFTYTPMEDIYPETMLTFTDTSTDADGTIASWAWSFGDGITSTEQNPTHAYTEVGTYTVTLVVTDNDGNESVAYTADITVSPQPPTAYFTYAPMEDILVNVTTIVFTDASIPSNANITDWSWDFGDGTNSTEQNTTHMYTAIGDFIVTLTVTDADGLMGTKSVIITVV
jgi:PKD repeat protein